MARTAKSGNRDRKPVRGNSRSTATLAPPETPARKPIPQYLVLGGMFAIALAVAFIVYAPSLNGDFVFDDRNLPMLIPYAATMHIKAWLGVRPLLMGTYFLNFKTAGLARAPYHAVNVFFHAANALLIFTAIRRVLEWARVGLPMRSLLSVFAAAVFLLHPVQTEAVSYIASRSEVLSVFFFLLAFNVFLYRSRSSVTFGTAAAVLLLYACAMTSKEHTAVLPAVLLLTDYFWNPGFSFTGIRRNWKLYAPIAIAALLGGLFFLTYVNRGSNIGFHLEKLAWYEYLFTEFRALFVYARLFVLPFGQSADYVFPISRNPFDRGAIVYGLVLLALIVAAIRYRKRFPLVSYGFFLTLILFAPTSSILPIRDPLAERRMYLPFIGFLFIACELLLHVHWPNRRAAIATLSAVCIAFALLSFRRNAVWVNMESLWLDAVNQNGENARALMGLGDAYAMSGRCAQAIPYFERAMKLEKADYRHTYNLAEAYDCAGNLSSALSAYQNAIRIRPTAEAWAHIGVIEMKNQRIPEAFQAFDTAQRVDASYLLTSNYRGILFLALGRFLEAEQQFQNVLRADPANQIALRGIDRVQNRQRQF